MARRVGGWDAVRAWRFIRASKAYRAAWARRRHLSGLPERAPFPVRLQTAADLAAAAWGMRPLKILVRNGRSRRSGRMLG